jgi:hypothetical protein
LILNRIVLLGYNDEIPWQPTRMTSHPNSLADQKCSTIGKGHGLVINVNICLNILILIMIYMNAGL